MTKKADKVISDQVPGERRNLVLRAEVRDALDFIREDDAQLSLSEMVNRVILREAKEHGWVPPVWVKERRYWPPKRQARAVKARRRTKSKYFSTSYMLYPPADQALDHLFNSSCFSGVPRWSLAAAIGAEIIIMAQQRGWKIDRGMRPFLLRSVRRVRVPPKGGRIVHWVDAKNKMDVACRIRASREIVGSTNRSLVTCKRCIKILEAKPSC